ncbi:MAG: class I SAM-dependent methyltransferase [Calditrichaeota bacterium]|nr:MAG: class I SAM-dependent methyltransferase [Calditrichota bacterium]
MECRICQNDKKNKSYKVREMMYGFKDEFEYFQCSDCDCLQILNYPKNMDKYYSDNYYSKIQKNNGIKKIILNLRDKYSFYRKGLLGKILNEKFPNLALESLSFLDKKPNSKELKIVDIGCGAGNLLFTLREFGFENTLGVDPFISKEINYENGLKIVKGELSETKDKWDIVMFHHSFEHIPFQIKTLKNAKNLLTENGLCLIRIPVVSSYAWENYGVNWVQLDAPRHFYLHSIKSMEVLAKQCGMRLGKVEFDSETLQFWGSEQYLKDIPLNAKESYANGVKNSIFSSKEISEFAKRAKDLNKNQRGDQANFFLYKQ